jgi:hypothetical protein
MARKLTKVVGAAMGSAMLAGLPLGAQAAPVLDTEPNNSFPGQAANVGDVITGTVDFEDTVDFFQYSGLTPGSFFDVFVELTAGNGPVFTDASTSGLVQLDFDTLLGNLDSVHLNGIVPVDGKVVVQMSNQDPTQCCFEGYRISLTQRAAVPMPASLALVAAGLVGLGAFHVARRKKAA